MRSNKEHFSGVKELTKEKVLSFVQIKLKTHVNCFPNKWSLLAIGAPFSIPFLARENDVLLFLGHLIPLLIYCNRVRFVYELPFVPLNRREAKDQNKCEIANFHFLQNSRNKQYQKKILLI